MNHSPVTVHTVEDLALAAPAMLGYWPAGSLCIIVVDDDQRVILIMRWQHAEAHEGDVPLLPPALPEAGPGQPSPAAFHLVNFPGPCSGDVATEPCCRPEHGLDLAAGLQRAGLSRGQALMVACDGDGVSWTPLEPVASGTTGEQHMTGAQVMARLRRWGLPLWQQDRAAYVGDIEPDPESIERVRHALATQMPLVESRRDEAIARMRQSRFPEGIPAQAVAETLVALADVAVRDTLIWEVMHDDPAQWMALAEDLAGVVSASPDSHLAPPATVLAILRWQMGDGSRASAAVERALAADPDYSLARLVDRCLSVGLHPATWREGLSDLSRAECRRSA